MCQRDSRLAHLHGPGLFLFGHRLGDRFSYDIPHKLECQILCLRLDASILRKQLERSEPVPAAAAATMPPCHVAWLPSN